MFLRTFSLSLVAVLLSSCGSDIDVVSKDRALSSGASAARYSTVGGHYRTELPSARAIASGNHKPKDKHGMPLYDNERVRHVRTTAYTCTEADHIEYGSMNAAGTPLRYSNTVRSAAADWSVYPIGTTFRIKGMPQLFVVDDYGSALTGTGTIDIYTPSHKHMRAWGRRNVEINIVRWGSYARSAELLSGRTRHAHCREMYANIVRKVNRGQATVMR
ncbi:MAG: 3D domain-containing protein [Verrucomicrobiales bacterium]